MHDYRMVRLPLVVVVYILSSFSLVPVQLQSGCSVSLVVAVWFQFC